MKCVFPNLYKFGKSGYRDHLEQFLFIAEHLFKIDFDFNFDSVFMVCYFHDIEKLWKYSTGLNLSFDKDDYLKYQLPKHGITLTEEELNAIKYIHGENEDYGKIVMTSLTAFCHACDVLSARSFSHKKEVTFRYC